MRNKHRRQRRGAITVLAALLIVILVLMVALAVDVGMMSQKRTQYQLAADAASLAGADALYDENGKLRAEDAVSVAQDYFVRNGGKGLPVVLIGKWDLSSRQFTETDEEPNAVRVTAAHEYPTVFGQAANVDSYRAFAAAVANTSAVPERVKTVTEEIRVPIYGYTPACSRGIVGYRREKRVRTEKVPGKDGGIGLVD